MTAERSLPIDAAQVPARAVGGLGLAFLALAVIPALLVGAPPDPQAHAADFLAFYGDHRSAIVIADLLGVLAAVPGVVFFCKLINTIRREERVSGTLTLAAALALAVTVAGVLVSAAVSAATAYRLGTAEHPAAETVMALNDLVNILNALSAVFFGIFLGASAAAIIPSRRLPCWLGVVAAVCAAASFGAAFTVLATSGVAAPGGSLTPLIVQSPLAYALAASVLMLVAPWRFDGELTDGRRDAARAHADAFAPSASISRY